MAELVHDEKERFDWLTEQFDVPMQTALTIFHFYSNSKLLFFFVMIFVIILSNFILF